MHSSLAVLPLDALSVDLFCAGAMTITASGYVHAKTVPHTIIAQATEGRYEIHCGDGRHADLREGEAFLTGPNLPLRITHHGNPAAGNRMRARWLHLRISLFGAVDVTSLLELPLVLTPPQAERFAPLIEQELNQAAGGRGANALTHLVAGNERALTALRLLCETTPWRENALAFLRQGQRLLPVLSFIRAHLPERFTVAELATLAHLSVPRFHVLFRQWLGRAPMDHVRHLRLSEASRRLAATDEPLRVVAEQTGFCSPFHLSREFRRTFGHSPAAYRRAYDRTLV